ncbi:MAG: hypothetical protein ABFS37_01470 [Acidobacteriota bacterium]
MEQEVSGRFGTMQELRDRALALASFETWDRGHAFSPEPSEAIAAVSSLYRMLSEEARRREDDPNFSGVQLMLGALGRLGRCCG